MKAADTGRTGFLDHIRQKEGIDPLKAYFRGLAAQEPDKAIQFLNEDVLHFSSLFMLKPEIEALNLVPHLNSKGQAALHIVNQILSKKTTDSPRHSSKDQAADHPVLKWIWETGREADGLSNEFDKVMEITAALLTNIHKDKTILSSITEMIFNRHRKGFYIYDLVWALFEARDPQCLNLIARHLCSPQRKDIELARKLLSFIPCIGRNIRMDPVKQYHCFLYWMQESSSFLFYTGESYLQTGNPIPYAVSLEAKYLCETVAPSTGKIRRPLIKGEEKRLEEFKKLNTHLQSSLSNHSFLLYRQNMQVWRRWLNYPIMEQIRTMQASQLYWSW